MSRRQLPEERALRNHISRALWGDPGKNPAPPPKCCRDAITALVRAVREEDAKKCDAEAKRFAEFAEHARKKGHNVDDIVARRIACEDLAAALRGRR